MSETFQAPPFGQDPFAAELLRRRDESLAIPVLNYVLLLAALPTGGLSALLALVLAYALKGNAGDAAWSHYVFQIRTCWWTLLAIPLGVVVIVLSLPLMFVLVGFPLFVVGLGLILGGKLWYVVRAIVGLIHAANGRGYPDPRTMLV